VRQLKYLGLERLKGLRDETLVPLVRSCGATLEDILLDDVSVGDASLDAILAHCHGLKHICLHGLRGVSADAVQRLYSLPKLPPGGVHVLPPEAEEGEGGPPPESALFSLD
jgi:hypothetical protein